MGHDKKGEYHAVKFWGGIDRNTISFWRCRREGDAFVCRALAEVHRPACALDHRRSSIHSAQLPENLLYLLLVLLLGLYRARCHTQLLKRAILGAFLDAVLGHHVGAAVRKHDQVGHLLQFIPAGNDGGVLVVGCGATQRWSGWTVGQQSFPGAYALHQACGRTAWRTRGGFGGNCWASSKPLRRQ